MITRRRQHNLTVLADGSVLATGGQRTNGGGGLVDLANAVLHRRALGPGHRRLDRARARRGRAPVPLGRAAAPRRPRADRRRRDLRRLPTRSATCAATSRSSRRRTCTARTAAAQLAPRPAITGAPATLGYDGAFTLTTTSRHPQARRSSGSARRRTARTRASATSRSASRVSGTTLTVAAPNNPHEAPAGHYMLFAIDAAGVPSIASIVQLQRPAVTAPPAAGQPRAQQAPPPAAPRASAAEAPGEGRQRLRLRRAHRQVLHQGRAAPAS